MRKSYLCHHQTDLILSSAAAQPRRVSKDAPRSCSLIRTHARSARCGRGKMSAGAGVALADEAQMVAEIGPQLARPFRVGGAFPCRRGLHLGRDQVIERDIAAVGAGGAEAARA